MYLGLSWLKAEPRVAIILTAILMAGCANQQTDIFSGGKWLDLSHDFSEDTIYWVTAEPFKRATVAEGVTDKGFYYSAYNFSGAEHGGTHIDSPIHFAEGRKTVDQFEIDQLMGPAVKIDVSTKTADDRDYLITTEDINSWERANGDIPPGSIILFQTGFGKYWPDKKRYLGTDRSGPDAVKDLHFPGLDPAAAAWLVKERRPKAVGLDTASIDRGQSTDFGAHVALMTNDIPAFENVADLESLPERGSYVLALPMKIKGGSGGPLRIVAWIPDR